MSDCLIFPKEMWTVAGRLFQARMWREYAMAIKYDRPTMTGVNRRWCLEIGRMTYERCIRQSRVNAYLARRLNRAAPPPPVSREGK
ncbi:hypothetical protein [Rhizobium sp. 18055]|uniref:hypothetical protein n=1 Tax=Rhizobium sp. 18055 TaxID=2681403 RepID=UPI00135A7E78|nr:hypothetical protein [Rhizobium sp. 18055]